MADQSDGDLKKEINLDALRSCGGFALAWFAWRLFEMAGPEGFFIGFIAVICAIAGIKRALHCLVNVVKLFLRGSKRARYKSQGVDPKADEMAKLKDLKKQGLLK